MRVDRDAAPIVGNRQAIARFEQHLDTRRMARNRLVHGIVEHLGSKMVQRALVRAADIHAGATAHRLQPLQHLDRGGVVISGGCGRRGTEQIV
jgi:hypothetical protein